MYRLGIEAGKWKYRDDMLGITYDVPDKWKAKFRATPEISALSGEEDIKEAVNNPKYGYSLRDIIKMKKAESVSILVSDATRAVPTAKLLRYVADELISGGVTYKNIYVFVAIGVHRSATEEEMKIFLGDLHGKVSVENHTPFDRNSLVYLGDTSRGTPVWVNRKAYECDIHIQIGKVEPHEFAGFSGGRKSVLPGISAEDTIIVNHRPEMILDKRAGIGILKDNPVHQDMEEAAEKFRIDFGVNCILNNKLELAAVFAGDMIKSHSAAVEYVRNCLCVRIGRADILVTTPGKPLDIDFYQSVKALIALTEVLDEKTVVVLYCGCPEGVNSPDMLTAFESGEDLKNVVSYTIKNYKVQMDHVLLLSKIISKRVKIIVCCPNISDEEIKSMFMIPCRTPEAALDKAIELTGKNEGDLLFYPRPQTGLPVLG